MANDITLIEKLVTSDSFLNGLIVLGLSLVSAIGLTRGARKKVEPEGRTVEVAGALIDGSQAREISSSVRDLGGLLGDNSREVRRLREDIGRLLTAIETNTTYARRVAEAGESVVNSQHSLAIEIARSKKG